MILFATQNDLEPQVIPIGEGNAPPPFKRLIIRTTMNIQNRTLTLNIGVVRSSSKIFSSCNLDASEFIRASSMSEVPGFSPSWRSISSSSSSPALFWSSASSDLAICVSSLSFVPSGLSPCSRNFRVSALYILNAFLSVLYAVKAKRTTSIIVKKSSGKTLLRNAPINAPAIVNGSITRIKSQSINGRSANGCLFLEFNNMFATAPPRTVTFDKGMAGAVDRCQSNSRIRKGYIHRDTSK
mmetsp:Transcript_22321/g.52582  ORF Transcript_22321/g.52582 Transcript_22321/m.52582 type:complete len:240 (-) Transcript_22321:10-729(-)